MLCEFLFPLFLIVALEHARRQSVQPVGDIGGQPFALAANDPRERERLASHPTPQSRIRHADDGEDLALVEQSATMRQALVQAAKIDFLFSLIRRVLIRRRSCAMSMLAVGLMLNAIGRESSLDDVCLIRRDQLCR